MKILLIDCTMDPSSWGSTELQKSIIESGVAGTLYTRRAPHDDLPKNPKSFDRIVISGSRTAAKEEAPWISSLMAFIRSTIEDKVPTFGVCYGHQIIARTMGGLEAVGRSSTPEFGWAPIEVTDSSAFTSGLPKKFHSFCAHYDEVKLLPKGFKRLMRSDRCDIQAYQVENHPIFGVQFHPERGPDGTVGTFKELLAKKEGKGDHIINPDKGPKLHDPNVSATLFRNFLKL